MASECTRKLKKLKSIYIPRPSEDSDSDEWRQADRQVSDPPAWHRYFKPDELLNRFEPNKECGRGSYGVHYRGRSLQIRKGLEKDQKICIRKIRYVFRMIAEDDMEYQYNNAERILTELRLFRYLKVHENILHLYDIIPPKHPTRFPSLIIILEYYPADLGKVFRTNQFFTAHHVQHILYQILSCVNYMHSMDIAHRNLKPRHIRINENCVIKIDGFDKACYIDINNHESIRQRKELQKQAQELVREPKERERYLREMKERKKRNPLFKKLGFEEWRRWKRERFRRYPVTKYYQSPEDLLWTSTPANSACRDVWSIGCIFAELLQMQRENRPDPTKRGKFLTVL